MTGHQRLTSLLGVDFSASRPFATVEAILEHIALAAGPIIDVEDRNYPVISAGPPGPSSLLSRTKSLPTLKTKFYQISMNVGAAVDAQMIFLATPAESLVPHMLLEVMKMGPTYGVFIHVFNKVDLQTNGDHCVEVFTRIHELREEFKKLGGVEPPLRTALLGYQNPFYITAFSLTEEAYERAQPLFISFIDHFISLSTREAPLPVEPDSADPVLIAKRDHTIRSRMFSPVADPMWMNIAKMVGQEAADGMRHTLATL